MLRYKDTKKYEKSKREMNYFLTKYQHQRRLLNPIPLRIAH